MSDPPSPRARTTYIFDRFGQVILVPMAGLEASTAVDALLGTAQSSMLGKSMLPATAGVSTPDGRLGPLGEENGPTLRGIPGPRRGGWAGPPRVRRGALQPQSGLAGGGPPVGDRGDCPVVRLRPLVARLRSHGVQAISEGASQPALLTRADALHEGFSARRAPCSNGKVFEDIPTPPRMRQ